MHHIISLYNFGNESPPKRRQVAKKRTIPAHLYVNVSVIPTVVHYLLTAMYILKGSFCPL